MEFQNFLDRLMAGDVRSFIVLALLALLIFIVITYLRRVLHPYRGYIKFVAVLLVCLGLYIWINHPERMGAIFNNLVDWIAARIEPLLGEQDQSFLD